MSRLLRRSTHRQGFPLPGFRYRIPFTFDRSVIDEDLTDFPFILKLSSASGKDGKDLTAVFRELGSESKRIAITAGDGYTQYFVENAIWDAVGRRAFLHVKAPALVRDPRHPADGYFYFDPAHAENVAYVGNTGETAARQVYPWRTWHLTQSPSVGGACISDSSPLADHGTPGGSMDASDSVVSQSGKGLDFDGVNDSVSISSPNLTKISVGVLLKPVSTQSGYPQVVIKNPINGCWLLMLDAGGGHGLNKYVFYLGSGSGKVVSATSWNLNQYQFVVVTYDLNNVRLYVNGSLERTTPYTGAVPPSASPISFGATSAGGNPYKGIIDEIQIRDDVVWSPAWIKATHHSFFDSLVTYGDLEEAG